MSSDEENESEASTFASSVTSTPIELKPDRRIYNASSYKVYKDYSVKLERVDGEENRNKIYVLQLLEKNKLYYVYSRWGKKGAGGQQRMSRPFDDIEEALTMFERRFKDKTGIDFNERDQFSSYSGRYMILQDDLSLKVKQEPTEHEKSKGEGEEEGQQGKEQQQPPPSPAPAGKTVEGKAKMEEKDPLNKSYIILKDICYEINVLKSNKMNDIVKQMSHELFSLCPDAFKTKPGLNSNEGIKQAFMMLNEYRTKKQENQRQEE